MGQGVHLQRPLLSTFTALLSCPPFSSPMDSNLSYMASIFNVCMQYLLCMANEQSFVKNSTKIWGSLRPTTHHEFLQFTSSVDFKHLQQQIKLLKYICKSIHMYILCVYALVFTPWKIKSKAKRTRIQKVNTQKMLLEKVKDSCLM